MSLKKLFLIQFVVQFSMVVGLGLMAIKLFQNQEELNKSREIHFHSWLLADELRQSSDDLTRMARTYVATGNPEFEKEYWTVLDIRNGVSPRPINYHQIYWDLVDEHKYSMGNIGKPVSLHQLMINEGFTKAEFEKLAEAQHNSDQLVIVERKAMNAIKGLFADSRGNFSIHKKPDREMALGLMNDPNYHKIKASIMKPINDFYVMFETRTTNDIKEIESRSKILLLGIMFVIMIISGTVLYSFIMITKQISRRTKAEEDLRRDEARLRDIILSTSDWIWEIDRNWNYCYSSESVEKILGYTPAEILGKSPFDFMTEEEKLHSGPYFQQIVSVKGIIKDLENWNFHKNGEKVCLLTNGFPIFDEENNIIGFRGVDKDITAHKTDIDAIRKSEDKYRTLVETMTDGVYRSTQDGKFLDVNPALVKMLGYSSKEELLDIDIKTQLYFNEGERNALEEIQEEITMFRLKKKDGTEIWVEDHGRHLRNEDGEVVYHEGSLRDVTERKIAEDEIRMKNQELLQINAEKDKFFSVLAHDLKGPFSAFLGFTQMLVDDLQTLNKTEVQNLALKLRNSSANLYRLLENLLEWASLKRGITVFAPVKIYLLPFIRESIHTINESAQHKEIALQINCKPDIEAKADAYMLSSILRNLVSNAVKFTPRGGSINISVIPSTENQVKILVTDTGIGMDDEIKNNLFHLDANTSRRGTDGEPSTGLGLILCKEFIEKHGSNLWVESKEGKGSTFSFSLPFPV